MYPWWLLTGGPDAHAHSKFAAGFSRSGCRSTAADSAGFLHAGSRASVPRSRKIDIHTHISTDAAYLREVMDALNLKMFTICNEGMKVPRLDGADSQLQGRSAQAHPRYYRRVRRSASMGCTRRTGPVRVPFVSRAGLREWRARGEGLEGDRHAGHRPARAGFIQIDDPIFEPVLPAAFSSRERRAGAHCRSSPALALFRSRVELLRWSRRAPRKCRTASAHSVVRSPTTR